MLDSKLSHRRRLGLCLKLSVLAGSLLLGLDGMVQAQIASPVSTQASAANSGEGSGTIAASTTFQLIWGPQAQGGNGPHRRACVVLNNSGSSGHEQWVYFQGPGMTTPTAGNSSALRAKSFPLDIATGSNLQGGNVSCVVGGSSLQDSVWISGTIGDTFVAKQQ